MGGSSAHTNPPPGRRRRSTTALLCVALLADDATAIRAYQCCASSSSRGGSRRRSRLASPRLCDERQVLGDPATILGFGEALRQGDVSPQLEPGSMPPTISRGIDGLEVLREDELRQLEELDEPAVPMLSPASAELLQRSLDSLDYSGNWSDPSRMRDSMVLSCVSPELLDGPGGLEYSCRNDKFTRERHELHEHIIERMLASASPGADYSPTGGRATAPAAVGGGSLSRWQRGAARGAARRSLGEQYEQRPVAPSASPVRGYEHETGSLSYTNLATLASSGEQHVFIAVGVPGSGKDSVLKRYVRSLGIDLLDASADRVKEYLAAYGTDELSVSVREHNAKCGPGKHLLHAQYLHRESIYLIDDIVKRAMTQRRSLLLEKTLFDAEHVLEYARRFAAEGCRTHLLATHITPLRNWEFLSNRMSSGQSFGRYISKAQAVTSLRQYDANLRSILNSPGHRAVFDSIHVFDVQKNNWCVAWTPGVDDDDYTAVDEKGT